jgi:hypothetical protein
LFNEQEVARVVPLLLGHSALFEAASIDLGLHTEQGLIAFQAQQPHFRIFPQKFFLMLVC